MCIRDRYLTIRGGGSPNRMVIDSYEGGGGGADIDFASNGSTKVRITSNGFLLLGTTDSGFSSGYTNMTIGNTSTQNTGLTIASSSSNGYSRLHFADGTSGAARYAGWIVYDHSVDAIKFSTANSGSQKVSIDSSGRVLIGVSASYANASIDELQVGNNNSSNQAGITIGSTDECAIAFADAGDARAGSITYNHGSNMMLFKTDGQNTRFDMDNDNATFYPAASSTKSFQVRKNGTLNTQDKQCIASFWHSGGSTSSDKRYIGISSSPDGVYGCHVGSYNDGTNPSWLQPGFYVATGHNSYLAQDHNIRFKISSNGNFYGSSTTISSISDARLKKNITDYTYDLNKFKQLQPKTFEWINSAEHCDDVKRGFSAQEVEAVDDYWILEDRVQHDSKDAELLETDLIAKNSKLGELDAMYVSVINQLITKIETLETKVAALEAG